MGDPPGQDEESDRENHHETQPETPSSEATTALPDPRSDCRDGHRGIDHRWRGLRGDSR